MPQKPNKLTRLWQELKRRKVFRVFTIYAATSYIIVELVNNIVEPLLLPNWTATLVIVILLSGLPVVIILSWIYDITGEGIIRTGPVPGPEEEESAALTVKKRVRVNDIIISILLVIILVLIWPKLFSRNKTNEPFPKDESISVAVLPFQNITNDARWNIWQTAIQTDLITSLSQSQELRVKQKESVNKLIQSRGFDNYSISPAAANRISRKIDAGIFIYGSIKQSGTSVRLNAQLYNTKTEDNFKSFHVDGTVDNILNSVDTLSSLVKNYLVISELQKEVPEAFRQLVTSSSYEAYSYFAFGYRSLIRFDYSTAAQWFARALENDPGLTFATLLLSFSNARACRYEEAKKWCLNALSIKEQMPFLLSLWTDYIHALTFETPQEELKYLKQLQEIDENLPEFYYYRGISYNSLHHFDKAIPELEKALKKYEKLFSVPFWTPVYDALGLAYHRTGQVKKENKLYKKAVKDFPDDLMLTRRQAILALSEAYSQEADKYISKYRSLCRENLLSESETIAGVAGIYSSAGIPDEAEKYYREALSLDPGNPEIMNSLAFTLIENDIAINQGIELIDKALAISPGNCLFLHTRGWGLYKQGQYAEAVELLEKSWKLKPVYDHRLYLHLEKARKAVFE
ncbi:MAG TPA: hypothetical protein ENH59_11435 [Bacteroidetes bacterium]|nr:hypothetical protein [Bacteroidota bacterium]